MLFKVHGRAEKSDSLKMEVREGTLLSKMVAQHIVKSEVFNLHYARYDSLPPIDIELLRNLHALRQRCYKLLQKNQKTYTTTFVVHSFVCALSQSIR